MKVSQLLNVAALALGTGIFGFFLGKGPQPEIVTPPAETTVTESASPRSASERPLPNSPNIRGYQLAQDPQRGLETLFEELKQSPMAQMDFEAMFNIWDMIQYLDASQLETLTSDLDLMGSGQETMIVRMMLLNKWGEKDGAAAMERVFDGKKGMMQMIGAMGSMMGWMRSDPEAAYTWFQSNGDRFGGNTMGMGKESIESMYFANKAKSDFEGTLTKLDGMTPKLQKAVVGRLADSASLDPEKRTQLLDHIRSEENTSLLADAQKAIVRKMALHDPKATVDFISAQEPDPKTKEDLIDTLDTMWRHTDPAGAVEFLAENYQDSPKAGDQISDSFGAWIAQDADSASAWLANQSDAFKTDRVFSEAGQGLQGNGQYSQSAEWRNQVLDPQERIDGFQDLYSEWKAQDANAADTWLQTLPESEQASITAEN